MYRLFLVSFKTEIVFSLITICTFLLVGTSHRFWKGCVKKPGKITTYQSRKTLIRGGGSGVWEGVAYFTHVPRASISLLISFLLRLFLIVDGQTSYSLTFLHVYLRKLVVARKSAPNHPMLLAYTWSRTLTLT